MIRKRGLASDRVPERSEIAQGRLIKVRCVDRSSREVEIHAIHRHELPVDQIKSKV